MGQPGGWSWGEGGRGAGQAWQRSRLGGSTGASLGPDRCLTPASAAGNGMVSRCSRSQNTVCRPCGPGFYNDVVSSKPCKPCTWCNLSELPPGPTAPPSTGGGSLAPTFPRSSMGLPQPQKRTSNHSGVCSATGVLRGAEASPRGTPSPSRGPDSAQATWSRGDHAGHVAWPCWPEQ